MVFCLLLLIFTFFTFFTFAWKRKTNFPPGPFSWPIFGNLFQLGNKVQCDFIELSKIYGNIFSVKLGPQRTVILNDYQDIKEALPLLGFNGRPQFPHFNDPDTKSPKGIIFTEGRLWEEQRRFVLKTLRDFGVGKQSMEVLMHEEIKELLESLRADIGKPICTNNRFNIAVFNALWTVVAGERFGADAKIRTQALIHHMTEISKDSKSFSTLGFFKKYAQIFPEYFGLNYFMSHFVPIHNFMKETVAGHKKTFQLGHNRDLLDCYLEQIHNTSDINSSFYKDVGETNLYMILYDIFFGGTETTSVMLSWTFLLLARHPDAQEKLYEEIKSTIGVSRLAVLSDRPSTPYIEAVILEVMRVSSIVPLLLRRAVMDTKFSEFLIPKDTAVYCNLYAVHQNKEIWGDPENFRPERFLSEDKQKIIQKEFIVTFGSGKRVCPGETLARDQLYLFVTSLFQNFRVALDESEYGTEIRCYDKALIRLPKDHNIVLFERVH